MATGFLYDPRYLNHFAGEDHPERPERLSAVLKYLQTQAWFSQLKPLRPRSADPEWLYTVHTPAYVARVKQACLEGESILDTPDVGICKESFEIAVLAAGGALELADQMMAGNITNGFALLRPPGHHAEKDYAMGFCLFNNVAVLARYLQKKHGLEKILILDWDVHHGNGTQHAFEEDPSVFYISLHQYPFYPGTGAAHETGYGRGKGTTLNCPMAAGAGNADYEKAFLERILPAANEFKPDAVLISAGFDAHHDDPLAQIRLTSNFFGWMSKQMTAIADQYSGRRLISVLEGGYDLNALSEGVIKHLEVLIK